MRPQPGMVSKQFTVSLHQTLLLIVISANSSVSGMSNQCYGGLSDDYLRGADGVPDLCRRAAYSLVGHRVEAGR